MTTVLRLVSKRLGFVQVGVRTFTSMDLVAEAAVMVRS